MAGAALVLGGCAGPGAAVAQRIRDSGSPLIDRVEYLPPSPFNQLDEVVVTLRRQTTEAQGIEFWCDVVRPAGGEAVNTTVFGGQGPPFRFTTPPGDADFPTCSE